MKDGEKMVEVEVPAALAEPLKRIMALPPQRRRLALEVIREYLRRNRP